MLAQDPTELFDVYHADGTPAGFSKPRADVHRDGDWHRSVHVWVIGETPAGDGYLILQRRGYEKDTWPGTLDVTVGGHYGAGETVVEALRESEEEIGVRCEMSQLIPLGIRVAVGESAEEAIYDRELQDVFLLRDDRPLTDFVPSPVELAELIQVRLDDLIPMLKGERESAQALAIGVGGPPVRETTIRPDEFVPTIDRYVLKAAILARRALRGEDELFI